MIYGGGGTVRFERIEENGRRALRLVFEDKGPGIADLSQALKDGFTTGNGLGLGLSGAKRLVNDFDIWSEVGRGHAGVDRTVEMTGEMSAQMTAMIAHGQSLHLPITDASRVAEARRAVGRLAVESHLSETDAGRAQIVATELANNLARHAQNGFLVARLLQETEGRGVEIAAIDRGPGMDVERCLTDGYSTGGTPGTGLGAAQRVSDLFDAYSSPAGTVAVARIMAQGRCRARRRGGRSADGGRRRLPGQDRRADLGRRLGASRRRRGGAR